MKFEYKIIGYKGTCWDSDNTLESLNKLGLEGWELIHWSTSSNMRFDFEGLFKRRINESECI